MPKQKVVVKRKQSGVRLEPGLMKKIKHLAIDLERTLNSLTEEAFEDLLKKYHSKK